MIRDVIYKYCSVLDHNAEIKRDLPLSNSEGCLMVALEQHASGPNIPGDIMVRMELYCLLLSSLYFLVVFIFFSCVYIQPHLGDCLFLVVTMLHHTNLKRELRTIVTFPISALWLFCAVAFCTVGISALWHSAQCHQIVVKLYSAAIMR